MYFFSMRKCKGNAVLKKSINTPKAQCLKFKCCLIKAKNIQFMTLLY
jgi:hypothetical protein